MDLFMRNIDYNISKTQIVEKLAEVLHEANGPFSHLWHVDINFHVHVHQNRNPVRLHNGTGVLSLPSIEIGELFLRRHGSERPRIPISFGRRQAQFLNSTKPPRADVLQQIKLLPFVNPWVKQEQERKKQELDAANVRVKVLQFGWNCRDFAFSVECEERCEGRCAITFDNKRREIRIEMKIQAQKYAIAIAYSSIETVFSHTNFAGEHSLLFILYTPPSYEKLPFNMNEYLALQLGLHIDLSTLPRQKLSFLPLDDHERVAPFTSLAIRCICGSSSDLQDFRRLCNTAQIHKIDDYTEYAVDKRGLFSSTVMISVQAYLQNLDWIVAFQMESLLRSMAIDFKEALDLIPEVQRLIETRGRDFAAVAIRKFQNKAKALFLDEDDAVEFNIVRLFRQSVSEVNQEGSLAFFRPSDGSLYESFHVEVTPTTMFLNGPFPEQSNRVLRAYDAENHDSFLRVSFVDEAGLHYRFDRAIDGPEFIKNRVGDLLFNGLKIAGQHFEFLAYSQSSLKEHSVWFVKPFHDRIHGRVDASSIIAGLGTFHDLEFDRQLVYCPARYAARISQAFTATDAVRVDVEEVFEIDDIYTSDRKYQFTDGVGTLSSELSRTIWSELKKTKRKRLHKDFPSAYQIRYKGSKGMLSVDYKLTGSVVCLRPSMIKFLTPESTQDIEIARAFDRPGPYFLNRPLIMLLEGLGVGYEVFKKYQDMAVEQTRKAASSLKEAASLLERHGLGTSYRLPSILLNLVKLDVHSLSNEKFYEKMLEYGINHVLRDLKNRARIPIPGAWTLVGVADIHKYLAPNQIFACVKPVHGGRIYLKGRILVSRSPSIHPGDVRIVEAIGAPPPNSCFSVEALPDTVVFSVQGDRPIPSCLGGGDLDGDLYNLIPLDDPDLRAFTPRKIFPPATYDGAPRKYLSRPSTMKDVAEFFMDYINSDVVGIIAINWLIIADQSPYGIEDLDCMRLADLHSIAVDYPKSGKPVPVQGIPKLKHDLKPDWNAPETVNNTSESFYKSSKAIGRLFREIDLPVEQQRNLSRRRRRRARFDRLQENFDDFDLNDARESDLFIAVEERVQEFISTDRNDEEQNADIERLFQRYASELQAICMTNTLSHAQGARISEAEVIIGTIAQKSSQPRKRMEAMSKIREGTDRLVRGIREELAGDDSVKPEESLERAWIAWEISISQGTAFGARSFGWVALGVIFEAIKEIEDVLREAKQKIYT